MKRRAAAAVTLCAITLAAAAGAAHRAREPRTDSGALSLVIAAYDARARGELLRSWELLRDAWAAQPEWLMPLLELRTSLKAPLPAHLLASLDSIGRVHDPALAICVRRLMLAYDTPADSAGNTQHPITRRCADLLWLNADSALPLPRLAALQREYPYSVAMTSIYAGAAVAGDPARAWAVIQRLHDEAQHPLQRLMLADVGSFVLHSLGRHTAALAWERAAEESARQAGAGAHAILLEQLLTHRKGALSTNDSSVTMHQTVVSERARVQLLAALDRVDATQRIAGLFALATKLLDTGRLTDAIAVCERMVALADSLADAESRASVRARYGRTLVKAGRLAEAESALVSARTIAAEANAVLPLREASHDLLHLYESQRRYADAAAAAADYAHYARISSGRSALMMAYHDLGWVHRRAGQPAEAQRAFLAMNAQIDSLHGHYLFWSGEYYEYIGALEHARELYLRSLTSPERVRALAGLVRISEALGDYDAALDYARTADRDTSMWFPEYAPLTAGVLARNGRIQDAAALLRRDIALARARSNVAAAARLALELAEVELSRGAAEAALAAADSATLLARQLGLTEIEAPARILAVHARVRLRRAAESATAVAQIRSLIAGDTYMGMAPLATTLFRYAADAFVAAGHDDAALGAFRKARDWADSATARLAGDATRAHHHGTQMRVSNRALALLVRRAQRHDRVLEYARWSTHRKLGDAAALPRVDHLAQGLGRDEVVIDYVVLDTLVAALVLTRERATVHTLPVTADSLRQRVQRLRLRIAPRVGSMIDVSRAHLDTTAAQQLQRDLIAPLRAAIAGRTRLYIVPDATLHLLPFDVLMTDAARPRYLLDDYTISYLPSLSAVRTRVAAPGTGTAFVIRAPDGIAAPAAAAEVAAIRHALRHRPVRSDAATSESALRDGAAGASILHFATHGEANDFNPDFARLRLAPGNGDDGWLHAHEIRTLPLAGALVVLSACETAAGPLAVGAGTLSLSRAFMQAGAQATVATLWPIGESTAQLMGDFYQALVTNSDAAVALRTARLQLRARGFDHPFYWAPFILTHRTP